MYAIKFKPSVKKDWRRIPASFRKNIEVVLTELRVDPVPFGSRQLHGYSRCYRIRVGNFRIIYEVHTEVHTVRIMRIRDRKEAYKGL